MTLTLVTAPAGSVVPLVEAKEHLRIVGVDSDARVSALLAAVEAYVEGRHGWTGRALLTQEWKLGLQCFPPHGAPIRVPLPPLQAVTSITYLDGDGVEKALAAEMVDVDTDQEPGAIYAKPGQDWPDVFSLGAWPIRITFTAGYGEPGDVPATLKAAIKLILEAWFDNPEAEGAMPDAAESLLSQLRVSFF